MWCGGGGVYLLQRRSSLSRRSPSFLSSSCRVRVPKAHRSIVSRAWGSSRQKVFSAVACAPHRSAILLSVQSFLRAPRLRSLADLVKLFEDVPLCARYDEYLAGVCDGALQLLAHLHQKGITDGRRR